MSSSKKTQTSGKIVGPAFETFAEKRPIFNIEEWNMVEAAAKISWGSTVQEEHVLGSNIKNVDAMKEIFSDLKRAKLYQFLSEAPSGFSAIDVMEFYNHSKVVMTVKKDGTEIVCIKSKVQGTEIALSCNRLWKLLNLPNEGMTNLDATSKEEFDGVSAFYTAYLDTSDGKPAKVFNLGTSQRKDLVEHWDTLVHIFT